MSNNLVDVVRKALRLSERDFDDEIKELIEEAKHDLHISGVIRIDEKDPLIRRAIKLYCAANIGFQNEESWRYTKAYSYLRSHLALSGDYNG